MAHSLEARVQRGHHYAILDEVDNILIDEARTPLIISGPSQEDPQLYEQMARVVRQLRPEDFEVNERDRTVSLTEIGENHVEQLLGLALRDPDRPEDLTPEQARLLGHLEQALRAEHLFKRNKDYVVQGGRVIIVDEFTGRLMQGRRWSDGLHQAVEAKEGVRVREENVTYATITLQNYFRKYQKLAGMTGTALTEAEEFNKIYKVDVVPLPTNLEYIAMRPGSDLVEVEYRENGSKFHYFARADDTDRAPVFWRRKDYPDVVYRTLEAKLRAVATEILRRHVRGQPLLVGTTSVELSERLSNRLRAELLQRLAMVLVLRDAHLEAQGIQDEGVRIKELDPLYPPLEELSPSVLRTFARDLNVPLNPARPENLARLGRILPVEPSEEAALAAILQSGIRHNVLNAKKHDEESRIIAGAGALGAVTIATNMAGRGVDIKLGGEIAEEVLAAVNRVIRRTGVEEPEMLSLEELLAVLEGVDREAVGIYTSEVELFRRFIADARRVREVGGLHVLGSERHEARRIDNQLRGRSARQGDPGSSQFFLSLGDDLMRLFGGSQVSGLMQRLNIDDAVPIAHSIVDRTIEQAQTRVEGANFDTRKHLLEYDDVLNQQREIFYGQRNRVFAKDDLLQDIEKMLRDEVERHVQAAAKDPEGPWKLLAWLEEVQPTFNLDAEPYPSFMLALLLQRLAAVEDPAGVRQALAEIARQALAAQYEHLARAVAEQLDRTVERLGEQVRQRVELAEMALEGAALQDEEAGRPPDVRELLAAIEQTAGIRLELDAGARQRAAEDPSALRRILPKLLEAGLAQRVWAGLIQAVEARVGESLGLPANLPLPVDWDRADGLLQDTLEKVWSRRSEAIVNEIASELRAFLPAQGPVSDAARVRALVQMSYGQRTFFDRRTHQRMAVRVARLTYAFSAAQLIADEKPDDLERRVLEHLAGAQVALQAALGRAEWSRMGNTRLHELDPRVRRTLERALGPEAYEELAGTGALLSLPEGAQNQIRQALGQNALTEFYRRLFLAVADRLWVEYLTQMEALRTAIGLEAYGQRDPLVQYKSRAFDMFRQLLAEIRSGVVSRLYRLPTPAGQAAPAVAAAGPAARTTREAVPGSGADGGKRERRRKRR
jgi:preprotein translocase subunit SecA